MKDAAFEKRLSDMHEKLYRALKQRDPDLYRRSIDAAEGVTLSFDLPPKAAVAVEWAVVGMVCNALGVKP